MNGNTAARFEVVEEVLDGNDTRHQWERIADDGSDIFPLKYPNSANKINATNERIPPKTLTIEGMLNNQFCSVWRKSSRPCSFTYL